MIYYALLGGLALQRLSELKIGSYNLDMVKDRLVSPPDPAERKQMFALHGAWFASCAVEHALYGELVPNPWFLAGIAALLACQLVRYHSMRALGSSWIHLPVAYRGQKLVTSGLYRHLRHPNYLAVAVEMALVPLLTKAYFTAGLFSVMNGLFLSRRINMENTQLKKASEQ